mgnify:FL=1
MSRQNLRVSVENPREGFLVTHCCKKPAFFLDRTLDRISEVVRKPMLTVFSLKNPGRGFVLIVRALKNPVLTVFSLKNL